MKKENNEQAITLIALIITIIILVVLAAVSIRAVTNMGIVGHAINGAEGYAREGRKENEVLDGVGSLIESAVEKINNVDEKEWSIAWVYKDSEWSNPYFKDEALKNSFVFDEIESTYSYLLDTRYSITSESELTGDYIAKLYTDGEFKIMGSGPLNFENLEYHNYNPWLGAYHNIYRVNGEEDEYDYSNSNYDFKEYLENHITTITIGEGITSLPRLIFANNSYNVSFQFPETLTSVDEEAFLMSNWIREKRNTSTTYISGAYEMVDVEINGIIFPLAIDYWD